MADSTVDELLRLNQRLLDCIANGEWQVYQELCDPTLTAIEPESHGIVVEGLEFHKFYFDLGGIRGRHNTTISASHVRLLGDVAIVSYVRHVQKVGPEGAPMIASHAETRVWQRSDGRWRHVHFHRSALA